jgi:hypothetical protein
MLSKFIFVMSIITNDGTIDMKAFDVDQCPEVESFRQEMQKMKSEGQFINWEAICIARDQQTESISNG